MESSEMTAIRTTVCLTSDISALVGLGLYIIDSSIWVAVMTILPER